MDDSHNEQRPDSFVFYRSFYDAIEQASDEEQLLLYRGISIYALNGIEPEFKGLLRAVWLVIKPQIEANRRRYINGCKGAEHGKKGGRPKQQQKSTLELTSKTPAKPQVNPTSTPNVNDNVNFNDNVNANDNVNKIAPQTKRALRFVAPTLQEIKDYISENSFSVDAERFFDYYETNGWMVSRNKMKDWKAAVRNWERSEYNRPTTQNKQVMHTDTQNTTDVKPDVVNYSERF